MVRRAQDRVHDAGDRSTCSTCELNLADIAADVQVTDEALHKYYDEIAPERYAIAEQRRARHILIETGSDDAAAKQRPTTLLARVQGGEDFAKLAQRELGRSGLEGAGRRSRLGDTRGLRRGRLPMPCSRLQPGRDQRARRRHSSVITSSSSRKCGRPRSARSTKCAASSRREYRREQAQTQFYEQVAAACRRVVRGTDRARQRREEARAAGADACDGFTRAGRRRRSAASKAVIDAAFSDRRARGAAEQPAGADRRGQRRRAARDRSQAAASSGRSTRCAAISRHRCARMPRTMPPRGAADAAAKRVEARRFADRRRSADCADVAPQRTHAAAHRYDVAAGARQRGVRGAASGGWPASRRQRGTLTSGDAAVFVIVDAAPGSLPVADGCDARLGQRRQQAGATVRCDRSSPPTCADLERTAKITRNDKAFE